MPLGTLDRTPPAFFRQGPSALTKLVVCAAMAVFLMVADARFSVVTPLRTTIATALLPLQRVLLFPVRLVQGGSGYVNGLQQALADAAEARRAQAQLALQAARAAQLAQENQALRDLLALAPARVQRHTAAEVLFESPDPYSRRIVIDRGLAQGLQPGSAVITPAGVLGQITRLYPLSAEVTLLSDRDAAIAVLNARTGQRAAAFGGVRGADEATMELRFVAATVDLKVGDVLQTTGLDGVYPVGLPVAKVSSVERRAEGGFARVLLTPAVSGAGVRHVLVLDPAPPPGTGLTSTAASASAPGPAASPASASSAQRVRREAAP